MRGAWVGRRSMKRMIQPPAHLGQSRQLAVLYKKRASASSLEHVRHTRSARWRRRWRWWHAIPGGIVFASRRQCGRGSTLLAAKQCCTSLAPQAVVGCAGWLAAGCGAPLACVRHQSRRIVLCPRCVICQRSSLPSAPRVAFGQTRPPSSELEICCYPSTLGQ